MDNRTCLRCKHLNESSAINCLSCGARLQKDSTNDKALIITLVLIGLAVLWGYFQSDRRQQSSRPEGVATKPASPSALVTTRITSANYERLKEGMSLDEVKSILGPIQITDWEMKGETGNVGVYSWGNEDNGFIGCSFKDGKLISKQQRGLKY